MQKPKLQEIKLCNADVITSSGLEPVQPTPITATSCYYFNNVTLTENDFSGEDKLIATGTAMMSNLMGHRMYYESDEVIGFSATIVNVYNENEELYQVGDTLNGWYTYTTSESGLTQFVHCSHTN